MSIKFPNLKRFFSLFLAAVMMVSLLAVNAHAANANKITDYGDAYGHWAYEALTWAVDNGVLVGTSEDRLNPDGYLTRAQMVAMIDRLFGTYKSADISRFTDVPRGSWHHDYIAQAVHMGTFAGYSSSRMGPNENITREQAMVVLARTVCLSSAGNSVLTRFPDRNQVGAWAADAVSAMVERGYVSGYRDGRLNPKGQITRAEMAQIMSNIFQSVHDSGDLTGTYQDTVLVRGAASIKDAVFESDLILANGLGEKTLDLNNITVKGRLVVWGGSAVNISGKSTVAGVVTPRNDGPVQVAFDAAATELSKKDCSIVYPNGMDKGNKVLFTDKADKPTIDFDLPAYRYVGDSVSVKTTLTGAEAVTWELTRDGKPAAMPEGFTKDGGICYFMEAGRYTLKGTVENSGGTAFCEKTVEVLPIGDIAFSLPEYGYTDRTEDVKLLLKNDLDGSVVWTLMKDGANQPLASFTKEGGTLPCKAKIPGILDEFQDFLTTAFNICKCRFLQPLGNHGVGYLLERRDIVAGDQIVSQPILLRRGGGRVVDAAHNGPQLLVYLPPGPAVADGVLGHLQSGHGHAAGTGGLGARREDLGAEPQELQRLGGGGHVGSLYIIAHVVGDQQHRVVHRQLVLGGAGDRHIAGDLPGLFSRVKLHAEAVGVGLHTVLAAVAHLYHEIILLLGVHAVGVVDIPVGAGEGDHPAPQLGSLAAHAPAHVAEAGDDQALALQGLPLMLQHPCQEVHRAEARRLLPDPAAAVGQALAGEGGAFRPARHLLIRAVEPAHFP